MIDILCGGCVVFVCLMTILWILATRHQRQAIGREMHQLRTPTQRERIATIKALNPWPTTTGSESDGFQHYREAPGDFYARYEHYTTHIHPDLIGQRNQEAYQAEKDKGFIGQWMRENHPEKANIIDGKAR